MSAIFLIKAFIESEQMSLVKNENELIFENNLSKSKFILFQK
jgi:hypothetical protein